MVSDSLNSSKKYKAAHENSLSFDLVPGPSGRLGQLSVMGSLQEIKLGLEMGKVYAKHLNPDSRLHTIRDSLSCVTTSFERSSTAASLPARNTRSVLPRRVSSSLPLAGKQLVACYVTPYISSWQTRLSSSRAYWQSSRVSCPHHHLGQT